MARLRFGIGPVGGGDGALLRRAADVLTRVAATGIDLVVASTYAELLASLGRDELQIAWLPPILCVRAIDAGATLLLGAVRGEGKLYHGALFVLPGSRARTAHDLRGTRVAWVDPDSCGGYLFPRLALTETGLDPTTLFAREVVLGSHGAVVEAVARGEVDCGATYLELHDGQTANAGWTRPGGADAAGGAGGPDAMRTVLVSPPIPTDALCASASLGRAARDRLSDALGALHRDRDGAEVVRALFQVSRFEPALPRHYDLVRRALNLGPSGPISSTRFR